MAHFARILRSGVSSWNAVRIGFEFDYEGGAADVYVLCDDGTLVAFEAKLERWRAALHQAYRTRCFAQRAYVVLPRRVAARAAAYEHEFVRRRVGLCTIDDSGAITVLIDCAVGAPLQPWINERAVAELSRGKGGRCRQIQDSKASLARSVPLAA